MSFGYTQLRAEPTNRLGLVVAFVLWLSFHGITGILVAAARHLGHASDEGTSRTTLPADRAGAGLTLSGASAEADR